MFDKSICVDLDGTLLFYTNWKGMNGRLGKPRPGAREFLQNIRKFARVIIFTARLAEKNVHDFDKTFGQIKSYLEHYHLCYDEIYTGLGKPVAEAFVDDKAISVPKNPIGSDFDEALTKIQRFMEIS